MHRIILQTTGSIEQLRWHEEALPPPQDGEAQVRHEAVGVNFLDIYHRSGLYKLPSYPCGLGVEAAGTVTAVGSTVRGLSVGQRVAYVFHTPGSYAEARNVPAERLVPVPDGLDTTQAAALLLQGLTADYLIHDTFPVKPGNTLLLHAAAGGVGLLLGQWAAKLGATVIGTAGNAEKAALALEHGCTQVIQYRHEDFAAQVKALTGGRGVDVVYDSVGQATFEGSLQCLKPRGMLVSFGQASGAVPPFDISKLSAGGSLFLTRPTLFTHIATTDELRMRAARLFGAVLDGTLKAPPVTRFALKDAAAAQQALEERRTVGKIVLIP
jgi:NADPH2:quinone reductase